MISLSQRIEMPKMSNAVTQTQDQGVGTIHNNMHPTITTEFRNDVSSSESQFNHENTLTTCEVHDVTSSSPKCESKSNQTATSRENTERSNSAQAKSKNIIKYALFTLLLLLSAYGLAHNIVSHTRASNVNSHYVSRMQCIVSFFRKRLLRFSSKITGNYSEIFKVFLPIISYMSLAFPSVFSTILHCFIIFLTALT